MSANSHSTKINDVGLTTETESAAISLPIKAGVDALDWTKVHAMSTAKAGPSFQSSCRR
jgi:hypothetical protein